MPIASNVTSSSNPCFFGIVDSCRATKRNILKKSSDDGICPKMPKLNPNGTSALSVSLVKKRKKRRLGIPQEDVLATSKVKKKAATVSSDIQGLTGNGKQKACEEVIGKRMLGDTRMTRGSGEHGEVGTVTSDRWLKKKGDKAMKIKKTRDRQDNAIKDNASVCAYNNDVPCIAVSNPSNCLKQNNQTLKNPGFLWDINPSKITQILQPGNHEPSSDDDSDDEKSNKKKRRKSAVERREVARLEEERLQKVERELLDPNRQLTSCDDFDRLVLAKPDSSALWLQYMAFHLQATDIEKARAVAQRAIRTISYRKEQEKLNVWLGLLNMENLYGTPETLKTTMDQALHSNDPYKIRAHMIRLYAESGKNKELEIEVRLAVKKFKETPGMWEEIGGILMSHGYAEKARSLLQQALPHLKTKIESVNLIIQFALMESRNHNIEQAKALMDPLLASYPQRIDIWCRYCDMLAKANQINEARELYKRCVGQKLPARKMKAMCSKFLSFEERHGTEEDKERIRNLAADYVKQVVGD